MANNTKMVLTLNKLTIQLGAETINRKKRENETEGDKEGHRRDKPSADIANKEVGWGELTTVMVTNGNI